MVPLIRPALLLAVQVYCPVSLREMRGKTRVPWVDRVVPSRDHVIMGVGSPVAAQVRVCRVFSVAVLFVGACVKVGGTRGVGGGGGGKWSDGGRSDGGQLSEGRKGEARRKGQER